MSGIELQNIRKQFGSYEAISGLSLSVDAGEFVVFLGPSGCGKTTLLRMIAGLESVTAGTIRIGDRRVESLPPGERGVAMVFQSYALYPHLSVRENMAFGLRNVGVAKAEIDEKIAEACRILELSPFLDRKPSQLSGGQRQRVAIGRAIVKNPDVFLFDEPLSNLDATLRARTRVEIARLHQTLNTTMIFVTHDQIEAMTLAEKIVVMSNGRIEQVGTPMEIYRRPATQFVATFVGTPAMNMLDDVHVKPNGTGTTIELDGLSLHSSIDLQAARSGDFTFGVRPEAVRVDPAGEIVGNVDVVERLGDVTIVHTRLKSGRVLVGQDSGESRLRHGDDVTLSIDTGRVHLFDADGAAFHAKEIPRG